MWRHITKAVKIATDLISPPPTALDIFVDACTESIQIVKTRAVHQSERLRCDLDAISHTLLAAVHNTSDPCFEYLIENNILDTLARSASPELPSEFIECMLPFFVKFVNTELVQHFDQIQVHSPLAYLVSRLEQLDGRAPVPTREFASELWRICKRTPLKVELLRIHTAPADQYPILDYFLRSVWLPVAGDIDFNPRKVVVSIFERSELRGPFGGYMAKKLFPELERFLIVMGRYAQTVQFPGKISGVIQWCNELFHVAPDFPIRETIGVICREFTVFQKQLAFALFLSSFVEENVIDALLDVALSEEFLNEVLDSIEVPETALSAIPLIQTLLYKTRSREFVLPPVSANPALPILDLLPPQWREAVAPPPKVEPLQQLRRSLSGPIGRPVGRDPRFYRKFLSLLPRFRELPYRLALSLVGILQEYLRIAHDLLDKELGDACQAVIDQLGDVEAKEEDADSPRLRAFVFAGFLTAIGI
jgi:hypothetical protein